MASDILLPLAGVRVLEVLLPLLSLEVRLFAECLTSVFDLTPPFQWCWPTSARTSGKRSIAVSLKSPDGITLLRKLLSPPAPTAPAPSWRADVLIDPFRPGVLERLGLAPAELLLANPRLIIARLTGFRRRGPYANMAGHDINYVALSGVLPLLGRKGDKPYFPANLLADFAGGGMMAVLGIMAALLERARSGKGQVVEIDMVRSLYSPVISVCPVKRLVSLQVTGTRYVSSFPLVMSRPDLNLPLWNEARGENYLDGGAPWYEVYETKDGAYMSVGALENHFYRTFLETLLSSLPGDLVPSPAPSPADQLDRTTWPALSTFLAAAFRSKTRQEWTDLFLGTESCCVPVLSQHEVDSEGRGPGEPGVALSERAQASGGGGIPAAAPRLTRTPAAASGAARGEVFLEPGRDTRDVLREAGELADEVERLAKAGVVSFGEGTAKL
ncbi:SPOSA6832_03246, partial [Sporobolomyces salmonicolor]